MAIAIPLSKAIRCERSKILRTKDGSLDRIIEIKTTLAKMRRVGKLKSIYM